MHYGGRTNLPFLSCIKQLISPRWPYVATTYAGQQAAHAQSSNLSIILTDIEKDLPKGCP
jgi:hypothetical protein